MKSLLTVIAIIAICLAACSSSAKNELHTNLRNQASFDLRCPAEKVGIEYIGPETYEAEGCNLKKIYKSD